MPRVLLVSSNRDLTDFLRHALQIQGFGAASARDRAAALDILSVVPGPDQVILDLSAPPLWAGGLDILSAIRQHSGIPVLVLAAAFDQETVTAALELGADDFLSLPFRPAELTARAQTLLRSNHSQERADRAQANQVGNADLGGVPLA